MNSLICRNRTKSFIHSVIHLNFSKLNLIGIERTLRIRNTHLTSVPKSNMATSLGSFVLLYSMVSLVAVYIFFCSNCFVCMLIILCFVSYLFHILYYFFYYFFHVLFFFSLIVVFVDNSFVDFVLLSSVCSVCVSQQPTEKEQHCRCFHDVIVSSLDRMDMHTKEKHCIRLIFFFHFPFCFIHFSHFIIYFNHFIGLCVFFVHTAFQLGPCECIPECGPEFCRDVFFFLLIASGTLATRSFAVEYFAAVNMYVRTNIE